MSIVVVAHGINFSGNNITLNTTGADLLIGFAVIHGSNNAVAVADSNANTWNSLTLSSGSARHTIMAFWSKPTTVGINNSFVNTTGGNGANAFIALSGSTATPFDQQNQHYNNDTVGPAPVSITPGSVTPTTASGICFAATAIDDPVDTGSPQFTVNSGFTILDSIDVNPGTNHGLVVCINIYSVIAAMNPTITRSNINGQLGDAALSNTFKATGGGGVVLNDANYRSLGRGLGFGMARGLR